MQTPSRVQESAHQEGSVSKALSLSPDQFIDEYVEPKLRATKKVVQSIAQTAQEGSLSQVDAARVIATAVAEIWGLSEFQGLYTPGSSFGGIPDYLMSSRPGSFSGNR